MELTVITHNPSKVLQIDALLADPRFVLRTLEEFGITGEALEDGTTLVANATKKLEFGAARLPGRYLLADDTGLFIHALRGEPGVNAAYWGGPELSTEERMQYCLSCLAGIRDRSATFRTVVGLLTPNGVKHFFAGEVEGHLLDAPRASPQPRMSYSALFVPKGETRTWAEMSTQEENAISHRGIAFRKARAFLESQLPL